MSKRTAVTVGVRELKNRLTTYLRMAKAHREVIVTERGKPVAIIHSIDEPRAGASLDAKIAALEARGLVRAPKGLSRVNVPRVKIGGRPLSEDIIADRR
jgi:prevent-host-death family protein